MSDMKRIDVLNAMMSGSVQCGADDLLKIAMEKGARIHKEEDFVLGAAIGAVNKEAFDTLINDGAMLSADLFDIKELYARRSRGSDIDPEVQRYFIRTLLAHQKPNAFYSGYMSGTCFLLDMVKYGREDIFDLIDQEVSVSSFLAPKDILTFIRRLNPSADNKEMSKAVLRKLLDKYRPFSLTKGEGEEESLFVKRLYELNMASYVDELAKSGEVGVGQKIEIYNVGSINEFFDILEANPNVRLDRSGLIKVLNGENIEVLAAKDVVRLINHVNFDNHYGLVSTVENVLDVFAREQRVDMLKEIIDASIPLIKDSRFEVHDMVRHAFMAIQDDEQAIEFLKVFVDDKRYDRYLIQLWTIKTESNYHNGRVMADWLLKVRNNPVRLSALLEILPINKHVFLRYMCEISNNVADTGLAEIIERPYLLNAILNHKALDNEIKEALRDEVKSRFEYAERGAISAIKMLMRGKKGSVKLKGELASRFIVASVSEQQKCFDYFKDQKEVVLMMVNLIGLSPIETIATFPITDKIQEEILKQD